MVACSTNYEDTAVQSWDQMASGNVDEALKAYDKNVRSKNDTLLRLMDEGLLLRVAGRYSDSNEKLFKASEIIERSGYTSVSEQGLTLLTNEKQTVYQGEDFEKTLVHVYLALNFIAMQSWDEALVEARKVNEILYQMIFEGKKPYKQNQFAQYLSALIYEKTGELNSAYVDVKKILKEDPALVQSCSFLQEDLLRMADQMDFHEDFEDFSKKFGSGVAKNVIQNRNRPRSELVLLFQNGKSPRKYSSRERRYKRDQGGSTVEVLIPVAYYRERPYLIHSAVLKIAGQSFKTYVFNHIERTAIQNLKDRMGRVIAKALLTAGVKAGIATGVGVATDSKELGLLAGLALFAMSEADTRSWLLLPAELQVAKARVEPGNYQASLDYYGRRGQFLFSEDLGRIQLARGEIKFIEKRVYK